jgi:hypothetical protein
VSGLLSRRRHCDDFVGAFDRTYTLQFTESGRLDLGKRQFEQSVAHTVGHTPAVVLNPLTGPWQRLRFEVHHEGDSIPLVGGLPDAFDADEFLADRAGFVHQDATGDRDP